MIDTGPYEQDVIARLHHLDETGLRSTLITLRLTYDPRDPYAVEVLFPAPPGRDVRWIASRDLLISGAEGSAGDGDIQVATCAFATGDISVVTLSAPGDETVDFTLTTDDLIRFPVVTEELVPIGSESRRVQGELEEQRRLKPTTGTADHE